jgi:uncharacterized membrane protein YphA (DoxX/SURF4 family)
MAEILPPWFRASAHGELLDMLLRRLARPMLAALFIQGGVNALRAPAGHAEAAKPVLDAVSPAVDKAVEVAPIDHRPDDETLVKIDAGVKIVAGSMLALGKFPRLASTALAASLVPTTLAAHRFWEETDEARKAEQQIHFLKNVGLLGGLLIAAGDTEGKPSLAWQGRRAARRASARLSDLTDSTPDLGERLAGTAHEVSERVSGVAHGASGTVSGLAAGLVGAAPGASAAVSARASKAGGVLAARAAQASDVLSARASDVSEEVGKRAAKAAKQAEKRRAVWEKEADKRRAELLKRTAKQRKQLAKQATKRRAELEKRAPKVLDSLTTQAAVLGHQVAERAAVVGHEIAHQAEGAAKDARKRVHAMTA